MTPLASNGDGGHLPRILREKRTAAAMTGVYCRAHHDTKGKPCQECEELLAYCEGRLDRCPFGEDKPVCAKCRIHCYNPEMRRRIREVMRFAGPRMLLCHPLLAVCHLIDSARSGR